MEPMEVFDVISPVPAEAAVYRDITADVISDLRLSSVVGRMRVYIYPVKALYIMTAILRDVEVPVRVSDMATTDAYFEDGEYYARVTVEREKYMPELTHFLWNHYTPANVGQPDRWTILVRTPDPAKEIDVIQNQIIANPAKNMHADMVEFSVRAVPEGFRVRYHTYQNNEFMFLASEDVLEPRWLELAEKLMTDLRNAEKDETAFMANRREGREAGSMRGPGAGGKGMKDSQGNDSQNPNLQGNDSQGSQDPTTQDPTTQDPKAKKDAMKKGTTNTREGL